MSNDSVTKIIEMPSKKVQKGYLIISTLNSLLSCKEKRVEKHIIIRQRLTRIGSLGIGDHVKVVYPTKMENH